MDEIAQGEGEEENMLTEPVKLFPSCRQTALNSLRVTWLHNEGTCPSQSSSSAWPGLPQPTWTPAAGLYLGPSLFVQLDHVDWQWGAAGNWVLHLWCLAAGGSSNLHGSA